MEEVSAMFEVDANLFVIVLAAVAAIAFLATLAAFIATPGNPPAGDRDVITDL